MDRAHFFDAARDSLFDGRLSTSQVTGIEAILDACAEDQIADQRHVAYILATPMIETGGSYEPTDENLNYSESALPAKFGARITLAQARQFGRNATHKADQRAIANIIYGGDWGRRQLGNTLPQDGWNFRGRGLVQVTGRRNYDRFGRELGIDLISNPDLATDIKVAAKILVLGMRDGLFTGRALRHYFTQTSSDWVNARQIVNGNDKDDEIAAVAKKFNAALQGAA